MKKGDIERRTKKKTGKMGKTIRKTELFCRVHRRIRKMAVGYRLKKKKRKTTKAEKLIPKLRAVRSLPLGKNAACAPDT